MVDALEDVEEGGAGGGGGNGGVPFAFLCSLFRELATTIKPTSSLTRNPHHHRHHSATTSYYEHYPALTIFKRWFAQLQLRYAPLPRGTVGSVLRMMFPEEDGRRKYGVGERGLGKLVEEGLGLREGTLGGGGGGVREGIDEEEEEEGERDWEEGSEGSGCLGMDLEKVLNEKCQSETECSSFTIAEVDELLNELASNSRFTHSAILDKYSHRGRGRGRRSRLEIIKSLYRPLSPIESKIVTQIILKDLRPVVYPYPSSSRDDGNSSNINYSKELMEYNTKSVRMLRIEDVMGVWDSMSTTTTTTTTTKGLLGKLWRMRGEMDDVVKEYEECGDNERLRRRALRPKLGSMIKLPKSVKGRNCHHALSYFQNSTTVWAETKYDGERAQIHVEILEDGASNIRIWSKSGRESTWDRVVVHEIVRDALGLSRRGGKGKVNFSTSLMMATTMRVKRNVVLDAEMVAWYKDDVDEFWRIRGLVEQTASGPRGKTKSRKHQHDNFDLQDEEDCDSQSSMMTDNSQSRHLALIFFDILVLDDEPILFESYATRRQRLEALIRVIPTKAMLSDRYPIEMSPPSTAEDDSDPHQVLQNIFAEHLADHREGLILKADESQYNEYGLPWVKLKKDYIAGFGDCVDLVLVGAGWDRDRARELRVSPNVFTTFFVGVITNLRDCQLQPDVRPHILVYFTVSYGLTRKDLEDLNFRIKNGDNVVYPPSNKDLRCLPFTFTVSSHLDSKPKTMFRIPFLAEMVFAGFDKSRGCKYYEPRFPRITKIHDKHERPWSTCMNITELDKIARECVGKDRSTKEVEDWCKSLWGLPTSPTVGMKRQMRVDDILRKLGDVEGGAFSAGVRGKRRKLGYGGREEKGGKGKSLVGGLRSGGGGGSERVKKDRGQDYKTRFVSTNGDPPIPDTGLREGRTVEEEVSLDRMLNTSISCFINSRNNHQRCDDCLRWKKAVPKERRVHSLEALLAACKARRRDGGGEGGGGDIKQGIVFVDVGDAIGIERTIDAVRNEASDVKVRVLVFACNVDRSLKQENALLLI